MPDVIQTLYEAYRSFPVVSIDSRQITPGCIFFGLKGDQTDGSEFAAHALAQGARYAVAREGSQPRQDTLLCVPDPLAALQQLALIHRRNLTIPFLGITGSNGKTTTKELINRVLSTRYGTKATLGNLNNHIGVPLTILSVTREHQLAIIEMGANHIGEIAALCAIALPTHGMITNIGRAHLAGFGGLDGVKHGKSELYKSLARTSGMAFVNHDEEFLMELSEEVTQRVVYRIGEVPSFGPSLFVFAVGDAVDGSTLIFKDADGASWQVRSRLFGGYNMRNIAAAVAVGLHFQVPGDQICDAITQYVPQNNRSQTMDLGSNTVILDAYNANPSSMSEAIRSFTELEHPQKLLILGAMMELGEYSDQAHLEMALLASGVPNAMVILVGEAFRVPAEQIGARWYPDTDTLMHEMAQHPLAKTAVLIKGSRAMRLEVLLDTLKGGRSAGQ